MKLYKITKFLFGWMFPKPAQMNKIVDHALIDQRFEEKFGMMPYSINEVLKKHNKKSLLSSLSRINDNLFKLSKLHHSNKVIWYNNGDFEINECHYKSNEFFDPANLGVEKTFDFVVKNLHKFIYYNHTILSSLKLTYVANTYLELIIE